MKMSDVLTYFSLKYEGNFKDIYHAVQLNELVDIDRYISQKRNTHYKSITVVDPNYPEFFKGINCPPIVLFYEGNKTLYDDQLPIHEIVLDDDTRAFCTIKPTEQNGKIVFDFVIGCENHDQVEPLLEHIQSKGLPLKDYSHQINKNEKIH